MADLPARLSRKVCSPLDAAALIPDGALVAASGYTGAGDPKATLLALAARGKEQFPKGIALLTAAQLSNQVESALATAGVLARRIPYSTSKAVSRLSNQQAIHYVEVPLAKLPRAVASGVFGRPDFAIIEALGMTESGQVVLTSSVGITPLLCRLARHIIIEINTAQPKELFGLHDIYEAPLHTGLMLSRADQRVGTLTMDIDMSKVSAVVFSDYQDEAPASSQITDIDRCICQHFQSFLHTWFPGNDLPPIQTGIGTLSQAVIQSFTDSGYQDLTFFCGALQPDMLTLLEQGKARALSGGSLPITPETKRQLSHLGTAAREHLVLRSMELCNGSAAIAGLGLLAINTGLEIDLFGNVNSSHVNGRSVVNGIGGGASFAEQAAISVLLLPSVRKNGAISCIVPQIPHTDIIHHYIDVVITEYGIADLRGKDDLECAWSIIQHCAHPAYRDQLSSLLRASTREGGHHPLRLNAAFSWHQRFQETGSMLPAKP